MQADSAYKEVGAAAKDIIDMLTRGVDKATFITIRDQAHEVVPLTDDFTDIKQKIDAAGPDGNTNLKDGFCKANYQLKADNSPNKMVIFMSDGWPTSASTGFDPSQQD